MTLPGGPADKLGNRYEKLWTISEIVTMLLGFSDSIRIEDPAVQKAEFVVTKGGLREFHQTKRVNQSGKWSLAALAAKDAALIQAIGSILSGNQDRFVFASGSDARELGELSEAASQAASFGEFQSAFLAADEKKVLFDKLCGYWTCDAATAYERLQRIEVRSIGEIDLEQKVRWGLQALFLADPVDALAEMQKIVEDSVFRTIERQELIDQLAQRGYALRRLLTPQNAGLAIQSATERYLDGVRKKLIRRTLVTREVANSLVSRLGPASVEIVLTGKAGAGKTGCVIEVVDLLRAQGTPVLALRLDRLQSATSTRDLGVRLDLEESPVLVLAAAAAATGRPGVLIIDQLDAVSTMSGRASDALDIVEQLFLEARGVRARTPIHVVVVCRAFDWKNDARLRQLIPDEQAQINVKEFSLDQTKAILVSAGFDPALFAQRQLELLQLPQNLSLFLEGGVDPSKPPTFRTATELFDRYWDEKRRAVQARVAPSPDQWMEVMETLCNEMGATQQLSVPRERLDHISASYLEQLASEGVLTFDGRRYGFGHESFFDYSFARVFFKSGDSLVSFLVASEQHLFRRAQVRQVLVYLRDADLARYIFDLRALLFDARIRPHIKDLALALLAAVSEPTEEEWKLWEELISPALTAIEAGTPNQDKLSAMAWSRFWSSASCFLMADKHGAVERWLANERLANTAVTYLRAHQRHSPDRIADLLEPYVDAGGEWPARLRFVMEWADHDASRRFVDLFLRLIDNGTLDAARGPIAVNSTFWSMLHGIGKSQPTWAAEIVARWLRRRLNLARATGEDLRRRELLGYDHSLAEMLKESSERAPKEFVEHLLPLVLEASDAAVTDDSAPKRDAIWPVLIKSEHPDGEDACLAGLASALGTLASDQAVELRDVVAELRRRDTHVANHLLLALFAGGGARFADEAVTLLCDEPWRFQCGYSDSAHWCAMQAIAAVVPLCTPENRARLETVLLGYSTDWERSKDGYKSAGSARFALLSAIPADLRSTSTNARFEELQRKFGRPELAPRGIVGGWVGPPIEKSATDVMTDDQWLNAIATYESDEGRWTAGDSLKGGAWQLSRVLETRTKEEPERFARLSLRFPGEANRSYLNAVLSGVKGAGITTSLKIDLCRKAFGQSRDQFGSAVADLLGSIEEPFPDDTIEMLHWLATQHPDPAEEAWLKDAGNGQTYYNGDIYTNGINTTRGRAAGAIQDLIISDADYVARFVAVFEKMVQDPSAAVRSCVAGTLRAVWHRDATLGAALFERMTLAEDGLLATHHVYHLILAGLRGRFDLMRPFVERMLRSGEPNVCEAGARLAGIAALEHGESAADLVKEALRGSAKHRLGIAQVASANVAQPESREWCERQLRGLFNDEAEDVRQEAATCFRYLKNDSLETYGELILAFCDSRGYQEDSFSILHMLEQSLGRLPGITCIVCEKFLDRFSGDANDIRSRRYGDSRTVASLIFRTYQQHPNDEWTGRALDLIDRLCAESIADARKEFEQFER
jgi:hypothetical protein